MAFPWHAEGTVLVACNCDYGCPCNFQAPPTNGHCEGGWTWHVERGSCGDILLDGLNLSVLADWPGAIHEGGGEAVAFLDERADEAQRQALATLVTGEAGGPWGIFRSTYDTLHGPYPARYELELAGDRSSLRVGDAVELEVEPVRNPVTGADMHPRLALPEGLVFREGALVASRVFRVSEGVSYDHSGKYAAVGRFACSGE